MPGPADRGKTAGLDGAWRWWRECRPPARLLHLDAAAAARSSTGTLRATAAHAEREAETGAYVAEAEAEPVLEAGRAALGRLLGVPGHGVAFVESATAALDRLLSSWPLRPGGPVAVLPSEWGSNLKAFGNHGLAVAMLPADGDGRLDLPGLEAVLASTPPAVVHLTQVASHRPLVQPVAEAAALCRAAGVPLWVDAAQALGHTDTACGADASYATSRKWLAGPRGVGLLAVAGRWWDALHVRTTAPHPRPGGGGRSAVQWLESREANVAGRVGLCAAVGEFLAAGPRTVWARLAEIGSLTREVLAGLPGWAVLDAAGASAITALRPTAGQDAGQVRARLLAEHRILITAQDTSRAPGEMTGPLLRISPHVDTSPGELEILRRALSAVG